MFNLRSQSLKLLLSLGLLSTTAMLPGTVNAQTQGFTVNAWAEITQCNDGLADNTLEVYGTARVNGSVTWNLARNKYVKKECGHTIQILNGYSTNDANFRIDLTLMDRDTASSDDKVGVFKYNLNLDNLKGKTWSREWRSGDGEGSKLYITVK